MAKKNQTRRKNDKKRRAGGGEARSRHGRERHYRGLLFDAGRLMDRGQWDDAVEKLRECDRLQPDRECVLQMLAEAYHRLGDAAQFTRICRRLAELSPDDPANHLALAGAYMMSMRPASALRAFRRLVQRWPEEGSRPEVIETIAGLEAHIDEIIADAPFPECEKIDLAAMHEETMSCLETGDYARAYSFGNRILARAPRFVPTMNNLSLAYFADGRPDEAVAMAYRVLEVEPDNFHALANLARFLLLSGRRVEGEEVCERLRRVQSDRDDVWTKKAEVLSYYGDDQGVLDAWEGAQAAGVVEHDMPEVAMLYHLVAVVHARRGDDKEANVLWRKALRISPSLSLARDNLEDAQKPIGKRHGAWAYDLEYWISRKTITDLADAVGGDARDEDGEDDDNAIERATRQFAEKHPEIAAIVPEMLERGGPAACDFAVRFIRVTRSRDLLETLRRFALSQYGSDSLRGDAITFLSNEGVLDGERQRLWVRGKWTDIEMLGFDVTDEPVGPTHCDEVEQWASEAMEAIRQGDGATAETLLKKCLEIEEDKPDLWNNLAAAYGCQGREDEAVRLIRRTNARWPDYFFGRVGMARLATLDGDFDLAEEYLDPLRRRKRLHRTEFVALCFAEVSLSVERGEIDAAKSWRDMLAATADPDDPALESINAMIVDAELPPLVEKTASLGRRRRK